MKTILLILACLAGFTSIAQEEITDTRKKNESFVRMPKDQTRSDLSTFTMSGIDESINKELLKKIPFKTTGPDSMTFEGEGIFARIRTAPFDASKHKLEYDEKTLTKIDKKTYYGGYGSLPKTKISEVFFMVGKDTVKIPPAAYADLYNLNLTYRDKGGKERSTNAIYLSKDGRNKYLYLFCKDKTGNYEVTWIIRDKGYVRRVLDYDFLNQ
jgi:hypothetical protein